MTEFEKGEWLEIDREDHSADETNDFDYSVVVLERKEQAPAPADVRVGLGHNMSLFTSVGVLIVNDLNGIQSELDYQIIGGTSITY